MNELDWMIGRRFQSLSRREYDWVVRFDREVTMVVWCLWRLIEADRIRFTSQDDKQQFGLQAPVDASAEVNQRLANAAVETIDLRRGTLDLELRFGTGHILQIVSESSGYEAWNLCRSDKETYTAIGGGELSILPGPSPSGSE